MLNLLEDSLIKILDNIKPVIAKTEGYIPAHAMGCGCTGNCGQSCSGGCEAGCTGNCGRSCSGGCS